MCRQPANEETTPETMIDIETASPRYPASGSKPSGAKGSWSRAKTPRGGPLGFEVTVAYMMPHEMDHLDEVLVLDHTDREVRRRAMRQRRERLLVSS